MANASELADDLRELKDDLPEALSDASKQGLERTERTSKSTIRSKDIEYEGDLRRSHRIVPNDNGGHTLKVGGSAAPHATLTEFGTGTHFEQYTGETQFGPYDAPSLGPTLIQNISEWVDKKGIQANHVPQSDLGYVIAVSIANSGTSRQPYLGPAWFATEDDVKKEHRRAVNKAVQGFY